MSRSKFVSDPEYQVILSKVNQVICQFSKSADKSSDAILFLTRIEEKCTSREEFLSVIEKRLDLLSNPNKSQEYVEWFKSKRSSLVTLLQSVKEKLVADSGYLNKFTPSFAKGMQCLDKLLKMNVEDIGHNQMVDLTRIQKAMHELKGGVNQKAKSPEAKKPPADPSFLYIILLEVVYSMNALGLLSEVDKCAALYDKIGEYKNKLDAHLTTHSEALESSLCTRIKTTINLLAELYKHSQPVNESDTPGMPMPLIYAVLCDLKAVEWRHLQESLATNADSNAQEMLQQVQKRRRTAVTLSTTANPSSNGNSTVSTSSNTSFPLLPVDQKLLDSLQQHQNQLELSTTSDRIEHFQTDLVRNEEAFELFEWDTLLDVNTHAGSALVHL